MIFNGQSVTKSTIKHQSEYRRSVQFIQQDSYAALNPVKTIYDSLSAAIETFDSKIKKEAKDKLEEIKKEKDDDKEFIELYEKEIESFPEDKK